MSLITLVNTPKFDYDEQDFSRGQTELGIDDSYPVGLLLVSSAIKNNTAVKVEYIDANFYHMSVDRIVEKIASSGSDYVGMNMTFPNMDLVTRINTEAKKKNTGIKTIVGGPAATLASDQFMASSSIDYAVLGEGEETIVELLDAIEGGREPLSVKGIQYRKDDYVVKTGTRNPLAIDNAPFVDISNIPREIKDGVEEISLFTGRGCEAYCSFCSTPIIWGIGRKNIRNYSIHRIFDELKNYEENGFSFKSVHFIDDSFTNDWKRVSEFIGMWNKEYAPKGITWRCLSRIRAINDYDKLKKMADAGCTQISVGVESASPKILQGIGKGLKLEEVDAFLGISKRLPIKTKGFFMIGFPDETEEDIKLTIDYAVNAGFGDIAVNIVMAYPGTRLYNEINREKPGMMPKFTSTRPNPEPETLAGSKIAKYTSAPAESLTKYLTINRLNQLREEALRRFYGREENIKS